jgi:hypothetical protein
MRDGHKLKAQTESKRKRVAGTFEINSDNSDDIDSTFRT